MNENKNDILKNELGANEEVSDSIRNDVPDSFDSVEPMEDLAENEEGAKDDEAASSEDTQTSEEEPTYAFKWEYSKQFLNDKKIDVKSTDKPSRKGAKSYAFIMITAFVVAFTILFVSISFDNIIGGFRKDDEDMSVTEIVEKGLPSSVLIVAIKDENLGSTGSGFIVNDYGYVVTNYHVVADSVSIAIVDSLEEKYSADLIAYDKDVDLALLYSENLNIKAGTLADSDAAKLGETVVAIGCPTGSGLSLSVSNGIISGFDRYVSATNVGMIQTNAPLNPGNSGGPLFDSRGNVVGIVTAKLTYNTDLDGEKIPLDGIAYARPINAVKEKIVSWITKDVQKPMLGITAINVEEGNHYFYSGTEGVLYGYENNLGAEYKINAAGAKIKLTEEELQDPNNNIFKAEASGIYVVKVTKGLGAYGKLEYGDIVTELNGVEVAVVNDAREVFESLEAGDSVEVKFYRDGKSTATNMTLKTKGDMLAVEKGSN
jgi:S1-C subfamily serine protease